MISNMPSNLKIWVVLIFSTVIMMGCSEGTLRPQLESAPAQVTLNSSLEKQELTSVNPEDADPVEIAWERALTTSLTQAEAPVNAKQSPQLWPRLPYIYGGIYNDTATIPLAQAIKVGGVLHKVKRDIDNRVVFDLDSAGNLQWNDSAIGGIEKFLLNASDNQKAIIFGIEKYTMSLSNEVDPDSTTHSTKDRILLDALTEALDRLVTVVENNPIASLHIADEPSLGKEPHISKYRGVHDQGVQGWAKCRTVYLLVKNHRNWKVRKLSVRIGMSLPSEVLKGTDKDLSASHAVKMAQAYDVLMAHQYPFSEAPQKFPQLAMSRIYDEMGRAKRVMDIVQKPYNLTLQAFGWDYLPERPDRRVWRLPDRAELRYQVFATLLAAPTVSRVGFFGLSALEKYQGDGRDGKAYPYIIGNEWLERVLNPVMRDIHKMANAVKYVRGVVTSSHQSVTGRVYWCREDKKYKAIIINRSADNLVNVVVSFHDNNGRPLLSKARLAKSISSRGDGLGDQSPGPAMKIVIRGYNRSLVSLQPWDSIILEFSK